MASSLSISQEKSNKAVLGWVERCQNFGRKQDVKACAVNSNRTITVT